MNRVRGRTLKEGDVEGFMDEMMGLYDLATELAPKEGKTHRETFRLICEFLMVDWKLAEASKELETKEANIRELKVQIKERLGTLAILKAIQLGKVGHG